MRQLTFVLLLGVVLLPGCLFRSSVIVVTLSNNTQQEVRNLEFVYPGGSFGVSSLVAGKSYQYRIKPFHSGPVEIQYLTADGKKTRAVGPLVNKEDAGAIYVALNNGKVEFTGP